MATMFLSASAASRLERFPEEVAQNDLFADFTLSADDHSLVAKHRGDANRLGVALQLCSLRHLGFVPADLAGAPGNVLGYVSEQVDVSPGCIRAYGERAQTRSDHLAEVRGHLGFHTADEATLADLEGWLTERALEHDSSTHLLRLAIDRLLRRKVLRPGLVTLQRVVATARRRARVSCFTALERLLTAGRRRELDALLEPDEELKGRTRLFWLRDVATTPSPKEIARDISKLQYLRALGVPTWNLRGLTPNRLAFLARTGRRSSNQALQRMSPERRYPILVSFLRTSYIDLVDHIAELFDRAMAGQNAKARRKRDDLRHRTARSANEKVGLFASLARVVLDTAVDDVRAAIYETVISPDELKEALDEAEGLQRPADDGYLDLLVERYSQIRRFAPLVLETLDFQETKGSSSLLAAVDMLVRLNREKKRRIPPGVDLSFVPSSWSAYVNPDGDEVDRRAFEVCALSELRAGLRAGDIWLEDSRRHADPTNYLLPSETWEDRRSDYHELVEIPSDPHERLRDLEREMDQALHEAETILEAGEVARIEDGQLVLPPLKKEDLPSEVTDLNELVAERLPELDLVDLLLEVDGWTSFTDRFSHAGGGTKSRTHDDHRQTLLASILAQACNMGLTSMAQATDGLTYSKLHWTTNWYLREETLADATNALVDFQHSLPLARAWGGGMLSSSDGQRFPVRGKVATAAALPRYFGFGKGLTFYTWTADQYAQYGTKVISSTVRDATYVLDAILTNETELPILEHTVDTTGYTELVFALFDLLGLRFSPRIRDLGTQRLYGLRRDQSRHPLLSRTIRSALIVEHWDEMLRVAGSLKLGWVSASLLISRYQARAQKSSLVRALQEYGRVLKSLFALRWIADESYRRRIGRQINKGEALHALRRYLMFANEGKVKRRQKDEQTNQAACLNLVTNAIIVWNTVYMSKALEQLRVEGRIDGRADTSHLSPCLFTHVNPYGRYRFDVKPPEPDQLRPLRGPRAA